MTLPECASLHRKETCKGYQELQAEIDRLRADLAQMTEMQEATHKFRLQAERDNDRLRAENAELLKIATDMRNELYFMGKDVREADAILAKTAKEGA